MSHTTYPTIAAIALGVVIVVMLIRRLRRRGINAEWVNKQWQDLQKLCADRSQWHHAVVAADTLLDHVLKRRHYKGKTTGERLVHAQHALSNNESVWFGHKLRNKIEQEGFTKISKQDTLEALSGFRQALKDLEAFPVTHIDERANEE